MMCGDDLYSCNLFPASGWKLQQTIWCHHLCSGSVVIVREIGLSLHLPNVIYTLLHFVLLV